jgi:hypothetical protein
MEWGISGHKVQPSHSVCAVECGTNGTAALRVKLKTVVLNGTDSDSSISIKNILTLCLLFHIASIEFMD